MTVNATTQHGREQSLVGIRNRCYGLPPAVREIIASNWSSTRLKMGSPSQGPPASMDVWSSEHLLNGQVDKRPPENSST